MASFLSLKKLSSSSSTVPSLSLNKPSSSITSKILNEGKISDGLQRAFVTLLAGNGEDIKGTVCLAKGLRKVKTAYPLVVAVLPGVPEEHLQCLESQGCILTNIQPIYSTQLGSVINFSKLRLWDETRIRFDDEYMVAWKETRIRFDDEYMVAWKVDGDSGMRVPC